MSFNVYSSPTGKQLNTDSFQIDDQSLKKQRVFDEPISPSTSTTMFAERKAGDVNSVAIKNQSNKLMMTFVQNQSTIVTIDDEPHAQLLLNLYSTQLVDHIMDSPIYTYDEQQVWSLAALLFGQEQAAVNHNNGSIPPPSPSPTIESSTSGPTATVTQQQQLRRLKNWICSTAIEEMQAEATLDVEGNTPEDIWQRAFYCMASGQVVKACELVQQMGDEALVAMLVAHFQQEEGVCAAAKRQVLYWHQQGLFDPLPLYQRKMWYALQGYLGYVDAIKQVVTQNLPWPQVLLLYTIYGGDNEEDPFSGLAAYHAITTMDNPSGSALHRLHTRKETARVPPHCQWYALLQWWITHSSSGTFFVNATYRKQLESIIPLRCRWLLLLHVPSLFENEPAVLESWKHQWCDELYHSGLEYMAILAGLFLIRPGPKIKQLLSMRQWDKEHYVARQLQIPPQWIIHAKALYALNHRLYNQEVDCYLEVNDNENARDAILNHMMPAIFLDNEKIDMVNAYLGQLTLLFPDDEDLQQTISMLRSIHVILNDYPRILLQSSTSPEKLASMANELALVMQNVDYLKDQVFCSKIAGQLLSTASLFMGDEQLNTLMKTCPVEIDANRSMMERLPYTMSRK
ncbi:unnamed protein product [Absidia cylindrospora]